ncbi:MAG: hypothetical protein OXU20_12675 [Myxococcales bacterium]|nr:hypothetical protein [Myxococcales bacterium]MDD9970477.1 hypothetical protein [Myxococcales bacterium]
MTAVFQMWLASSVMLLSACALDAPAIGPVFGGSCGPSGSDPDTDVSFSRDILLLLTRTAGAGWTFSTCRAASFSLAPPLAQALDSSV